MSDKCDNGVGNEEEQVNGYSESDKEDEDEDNADQPRSAAMESFLAEKDGPWTGLGDDNGGDEEEEKSEDQGEEEKDQ
ncbi:hypothetical protein NA57DRAFT_78277 [Rhizodiscina lignyota]|uniref:Uncharacterized protein n=1 Tax=Rhizodiscina lignyota TaxID=1504668 RepID=A0A9P4ICW1_9PEZI|nr:hypothetical protein NA57DRAFT_78277 [Rhizodiscina lignyota]